MDFAQTAVRWRYFIFSGLLVAASIIFVALWGLRFGIDFTGGSLLEVEFNQPGVEINALRAALDESDLPTAQVQPTENGRFLIRARHMTEDDFDVFRRQIEAGLGGFEVRRFDTIGPVIGEELRRRTLEALALGLAGIIIYIAWAFRRVSRPVPSWQYGLAAIIALAHDVLIVLGFFALLGKISGLEVGAPFVAALLTVLGYSVNDTIVVFDRVRENLMDKTKRRLSFGELVSRSARQSVTRSINVSLTTLLVLLAIFLFGGSTTQSFVLALIVGITIGTYSSLFLASPLLVVFSRAKRS